MKVLLGMSGGVDSTYAVHELRRMGYEVFGAVILMHEYTETEEAKLSAEALGVPLYVIDGRRLFEEKVVSSFMNEYCSGRTPNPCIICNREVKFKLLLDFALENGFDKIATGHYADIVTISDENGTRHALRRSEDEKKDQTYMLYRLYGVSNKKILQKVYYVFYSHLMTPPTTYIIVLYHIFSYISIIFLHF